MEMRTKEIIKRCEGPIKLRTKKRRTK